MPITSFQPIPDAVYVAANRTPPRVAPPVFNEPQTLPEVFIRSKALKPSPLFKPLPVDSVYAFPTKDNTLLYIGIFAAVLFILYKYKYL